MTGFSLAAACVGALSAPAAAETLSTVPAVATAGGGQPALAVGFDAEGALRAAVCAAGPCEARGGQVVAMPAETRPWLSRARLAPVWIGAGRKAVHVAVDDPSRPRRWEAVVVAPPGGPAPKVVWSGWTGLLEGEEGERRGPMVLVQDGHVYVGEQHEHRHLCGRPAIVAPKVLHPAKLTLLPVKVNRLPPEEREGAPRLVAERAGEGEAGAPLLRALWATSAAPGQPPEALTDGDPATSWAENRKGAGTGELVVMRAPEEVPIEAFELAVRPEGETPEGAAAARDFWIVTTERAFFVSMPEDPWRHGARYVVRLPEAVRTSCVALVTGSAFTERADVQVTFAELGARSALASMAAPELARLLDGGGDEAEAAGAVLRGGGAAAFAAVASLFGKLSEGGRRVALDVMDHAPCEQSLGVYLEALVGPHRGQRIHARDRIRRCGASSAEALVEALPEQGPEVRVLLADELALAAPALAVPAIAELLSDPDPERRRRYRVAFARAAQAREATEAVREVLRREVLDRVAAVDVLRALSDGVERFLPEASAALSRLTEQDASFRTRYLLLGPAAALSARDEAARRFVQRAMVGDPNPHLRAAAARAVPAPRTFREELLRAVADGNVRVREAAAEALGAGRADFAGAALSERLVDDPWPLVRAASARALGRLGANRGWDRALVEAIEDASPQVRRPALLALGSRRATEHASRVRGRLDDATEDEAVRAAAALALGRMCHRPSTAQLARYSLRLADPHAGAEIQTVGRAALAALGMLKPEDLAARLRPLRESDVPRAVREAAEAALRQKGSCGAKRGGARRATRQRTEGRQG